MAQANVAREPSMEEILASIRKIIESNDPADEHDSAPDEPVELEAEEPSPRPLSLLNRIPGDAGEVTAPKPSDRPVKNDHIEPLAPLRPGLDQSDAKAQLSEDSKMADTTAVETEPEAPITLASVAAEARADQPDMTGLAESDVVVLPGAENEVDEDEADDTGNETVSDAKSKATADVQRALISPVVGARVAASFGNLNHAVTNGPSRSFDDIAEDMLRPMLQQWMDDNLPTLVERLVREEIERVARGR